jgi:hypothetical protein
MVFLVWARCSGDVCPSTVRFTVQSAAIGASPISATTLRRYLTPSFIRTTPSDSHIRCVLPLAQHTGCRTGSIWSCLVTPLPATSACFIRTIVSFKLWTVWGDYKTSAIFLKIIYLSFFYLHLFLVRPPRKLNCNWAALIWEIICGYTKNALPPLHLCCIPSFPLYPTPIKNYSLMGRVS